MTDLEKLAKGRPAEIHFMAPIYEMVKSLNAKTVLEIGSGQFTFSKAILKALEITGGRLHTCDPDPKREYTHDQMTFYRLTSDYFFLAWRYHIDFLLIDGDHKYSQVKSDYHHFSRFVRKGGIICFHDINVPSAPGVKKLWLEITRHRQPHLEITSWPGLGAILA